LLVKSAQALFWIFKNSENLGIIHLTKIP